MDERLFRTEMARYTQDLFRVESYEKSKLRRWTPLSAKSYLASERCSRSECSTVWHLNSLVPITRIRDERIIRDAL